MNSETFIARLNLASNSALKLARKFTFNEISENRVYEIQPECLKNNEHLTEFERANLKSRERELNRKFTAAEVAARLVVENKVPIWINCSVVRSQKSKTVIELMTSTRFSEDSEFMHQHEGYPPFHAVIQIPPYLAMESNPKFDVNWRYKKLITAIKIRKAKKANKK